MPHVLMYVICFDSNCQDDGFVSKRIVRTIDVRTGEEEGGPW